MSLDGVCSHDIGNSMDSKEACLNLVVGDRGEGKAKWIAINFWYSPKVPLLALRRELCVHNNIDRLHRLIDDWNNLPGHVDLMKCSAELAKSCTKTSRLRRRRLLGNSTIPPLHVSDIDDATSSDETSKMDLSSRLWETEGTDPTVATLRKKLMDRNAPAALWGAIGEDDVGKLDELR